MGRMMDVLRQAEAKRTGDGEAPAAPAPAEDDFVSDCAAEEVPFIEVGPARQLEGSAAVLAAPSTRLRLVPQPPADVGPILDGPRPTPAIRVSLRPLSGGPTPIPPEQRFSADLIAFHQPDHPAGADYRRLAATLREGLVP